MVQHRVENGVGTVNSTDVAHKITLNVNTVCRDGQAVLVEYDRVFGTLRIGCTTVSVDALRRLLSLVEHGRPLGVITLQEGSR